MTNLISILIIAIFPTTVTLLIFIIFGLTKNKIFLKLYVYTTMIIFALATFVSMHLIHPEVVISRGIAIIGIVTIITICICLPFMCTIILKKQNEYLKLEIETSEEKAKLLEDKIKLIDKFVKFSDEQIELKNTKDNEIIELKLKLINQDTEIIHSYQKQLELLEEIEKLKKLDK